MKGRRMNMGRGIIGGVLGGFVGAVIWAGLSCFTGYEIGSQEEVLQSALANLQKDEMVISY
ncbi:MAG: hypothetical protein JXM79_10560 [Sedimentisphaerales bacterium]|nr:hypothetical protein [Sedimentisphaerales bacterium]